MQNNDIKLVPLDHTHLEMVRNWRNSNEVSKYMYSDLDITEEMQKNWYQKIKDDTSSRYWVIKYEEKPLGLASITNIDKILNSCYWAFYLGDTSVRGAGIGAKVEYNILSYVFETLNLNKLRCEVFQFNNKVIEMHEKFGFRREAYYREHCLKGGEYHDVVGLAMLQREWKTLKEHHKIRIYGK